MRAPRRWAAVVGAVVVAVAVLSGCSGPASAAPAPPSGGSGDFARGVDIGGRSVYLECHGANAPGRHTVVLIPGYHDSADSWGIDEIIQPPAVGPAVPVALARDHRVCTYDRPGTLRVTLEGAPLTERSTPVPQPRTAADVVAELHAVLGAAGVPGPYVLTGHSMGGLFARLYAQTHPDQVAGVVFVDAFSPTVPDVFGPAKWAIYRDSYLNAVPPGTPLADPASERIDVDASAAQVRTGPPFPPVPIAVLTKTEPFQTTLPPPPGLTVEELNGLYEDAQSDYVALRPGTPQTIANGDAHYIQWQSPDLVVGATNLVDGRAARP
ncbi:alpha/beta hydrolase [Actinomycetospora aeridis]|uniref:Alpha/beta hydrolase family protein n=1 Tax=Actinomycetospora aeridis TaxID=3129231 RepID=A0ABU8NAX0_9PSEU